MTSVTENQKLMRIIQNSNKMLSECSGYAKQNADLIKRIENLESKLLETREEVEQKDLEMKKISRIAQQEIEKLKALSDSQAEATKNRLSKELVQGANAITERDLWIEELKREIEFLQKQRNDAMENYQEQIEKLTRLVKETKAELQSARKENTELVQTHERQSQRARMKFEEHILKVAQTSSNEKQSEQYGKKLLAQKQEYEQKMAMLKKKLAQSESISKAHSNKNLK